MPPSDNNENLIVTAINQLTSRLEKNERDSLSQLQKMEVRLDQIVDLMRTVSSLQTQMSNTSADILELRASLKEQTGKFETAVLRLHHRMDETQIRNAADIKENFTAIAENFTKMETTVTDIAKKSSEHEKDWKQWFNRGWGVFFAFTIVFGFLNYVGSRWLDNLEKAAEATQQNVKRLDTKVTELESILTRGK